MTLLNELYISHKLKNVDRSGLVKNRHESVAEHTFSCIALAKYFLKKHPKLDENKIITLLLYHDFCEIYAGDVSITKPKERKEKEKLEQDAVEKLKKELPKEISKELDVSWKEYCEQKTIESKFAKAIDRLDPVIQAIHDPKEWIKYGFTEKKLRDYKEPYFVDFPIIQKFFEELISELNKKGIIPKE